MSDRRYSNQRSKVSLVCRWTPSKTSHTESFFYCHPRHFQMLYLRKSVLFSCCSYQAQKNPCPMKEPIHHERTHPPWLLKIPSWFSVHFCCKIIRNAITLYMQCPNLWLTVVFIHNFWQYLYSWFSIHFYSKIISNIQYPYSINNACINSWPLTLLLFLILKVVLR